MGFWDTAGRVGLGIATGGLSELVSSVPSGAWLGGAGREIDPNAAQFQDRQYLLDQAQQGVDQVSSRQAPSLGRVALGQAAQLDPSQQAQFRQQQMQQALRLGQIAAGQAQGAGELAAQRQASRAVANQQAMASMGRGLGGAAAARGAARNVADIGANAAGQAQIAALQDQQAANSQLGSLLAQGREADIGVAGQNAQLSQQRMLQQGAMDQQRNLAQLDAQLRQMGMNDQMRLAYLQQIAQMNQAEMAGRLGQEQVAMNQPGILGPLLQAGGTIGAAAASDERLKYDIEDADDDIDEMLATLRPKAYRYNKGIGEHLTGSMGDGRRLAGILAQDLERSKLGKALVSDAPEGKVVDIRGGLSAVLAGLARVDSRLRAVEGKG